MTGSSDDWMDDGGGLTMDDEDEDEDEDDVKVEETAKVEEIKTPPVEAPKPPGISLPMTGSSDDWMDDGGELKMEDEDEDEDDVKVEEITKVEEIKTTSVEAPKPSGISLPMTGSSDDWMDDGGGLTMEDEDEDDVKVEETAKVEEIK